MLTTTMSVQMGMLNTHLCDPFTHTSGKSILVSIVLSQRTVCDTLNDILYLFSDIECYFPAFPLIMMAMDGASWCRMAPRSFPFTDFESKLHRRRCSTFQLATLLRAHSAQLVLRLTPAYATTLFLLSLSQSVKAFLDKHIDRGRRSYNTGWFAFASIDAGR